MEWLGVIIILAIYFLPSFVAAGREPEHNSPGGVFVLNLFLGWTLVGWVIALAWASSNTSRPTKLIAGTEPMGIGSELAKLAELREQGILNELEFEAQKQKLLGNKVDYSTTKQCPHCAEIINAEAKVCRFCGRDVSSSVAEEIEEAEEVEEVEEFIKKKNWFFP